MMNDDVIAWLRSLDGVEWQRRSVTPADEVFASIKHDVEHVPLPGQRTWRGAWHPMNNNYMIMIEYDVKEHRDLGPEYCDYPFIKGTR